MYDKQTAVGFTWQSRKAVRVDNKRQSNPVCHDLIHSHALGVGHVAEDREDRKASKEGREAVAEREYQRVCHEVLVRRVIGCERHEPAISDTQTEEDLGARRRPDLFGHRATIIG